MFLYSLGVQPLQAEKILLNVRSDEKPTLNAVSVTDRFVFFNMSHARLMRLSFMYLLKEVFSLLLNMCAACERLICRLSATSFIVIGSL